MASLSAWSPGEQGSGNTNYFSRKRFSQVIDKQLRGLKQHLGQTQWGSAKGSPSSINNPMYNNSSPMGLVLENPHDGQNSSCHTGVPEVYLQVPGFSTCPSRLGPLGFTNLPQLFSVLEQSCTEGKPDTLTSLTTQHWFLTSSQKKRKICPNPQIISLQPQNRSSLGHFAKELP